MNNEIWDDERKSWSEAMLKYMEEYATVKKIYDGWASTGAEDDRPFKSALVVLDNGKTISLELDGPSKWESFERFLEDYMFTLLNCMVKACGPIGKK